MYIRQNKLYRFELDHHEMLCLIDIIEFYENPHGRNTSNTNTDTKEFHRDFIKKLPKGEFEDERGRNKSLWKRVFG